MKRARLALSVALILGAAALASPALAHAELVNSSPAADAAVPAPSELRLDFSEALELAFTTVTITGPDGVAVETGPLALDPADPSMLIVPLPAAAAGVVDVVWKAVAADGHKLEGGYSFTIVP